MRLGLGTGSTSRYFLEGLGERLRSGGLSGIVGVPTSEASADLAGRLGIPVDDLDERGLDLAVDGADEIDAELNAVKGLGGALTREKMVASTARRFILIAEASKRVQHLGERSPIPVEVVPFGWKATRGKLERLELRPVLREAAGEPFITDNGNFILDCWTTTPFDTAELACNLSNTPGVLEHGLFLGMADIAYLASAAGVLELSRL